jgi:hypothetical protein
MKCRVLLLLCVLAAASAQAGGITSFEPDTTARVSQDREPMVETPIWLGTIWGAGSEYQPHGHGLTRGPVHFSGFGFDATWPWRSRLQGFAEWRYGSHFIREDRLGSYFNGVAYVPFTYTYTSEYGMFALRSGVEYRFGKRSAPWGTIGEGVGYTIAVGDEPAAALDLTSRATLFSYPTRTTRFGLMFSAGPAWYARPSGFFLASGSGRSEPMRTHFEVALRIERRLRFPKANADADAAD